MTTVSLGDYRSGGCRVFTGRKRGQLVALDIREEYGEDVEVTVPSDVVLLSRSFRHGFDPVLPDTLANHELTP